MRYFILCFLIFIPATTFAQAAQKKTAATLVQCVEKKSKSNKNGDVTITETCAYKNYRSVNVGTPDYKGRTFWASQLYNNQNGRFVEIKNAGLFNQNRTALLALLNKKFQEAFKKDKAEATDPDGKQCFDGIDQLRWYDWDDISISFSGDSVVFDISYGLGDACYAGDNSDISLTLNYLKPYIK